MTTKRRARKRPAPLERSVAPNPPSAVAVLGALPDGLRNPLIETFNSILDDFRTSRWEDASAGGGKLCEIVYSIIDGYLRGSFPLKPSKPANLVDACRALEKAPPSGKPGDRSVRIHIPRVLPPVYEIRNNRNVGHVGGDVDPNHMDASYVVGAAKWLLAELVRIFHSTDAAAASQIVETIIQRETATVWVIGGKRRVLIPGLTMKDKVVILLHDAGGRATEAELLDWTEHTNPSVFRRDILRPLHKQRLIEYDETTREVHLSPVGYEYIEKGGLLTKVA